MARVTIDDSILYDIADAIRYKLENSGGGDSGIDGFEVAEIEFTTNTVASELTIDLPFENVPNFVLLMTTVNSTATNTFLGYLCKFGTNGNVTMYRGGGTRSLGATVTETSITFPSNTYGVTFLAGVTYLAIGITLQ